MSLHHEVNFESDIVAHLIAHGWLEGDDAAYDRALALYPEDVIHWLQTTQPKEWAKVAALHGADVESKVLARLAKVLDTRGSLDVLRHGFKDHNASFQLCQFKPGHGLNPDLLQRYKEVRCRVVRQIHYSRHNEKSIDLVFFVIGIPVATAELKTDFTQSVEDAIWQYKNDRPPRDPGTRQEEPLLAFKKRALVHFAVSSDQVYMTTRLAGKRTRFLPFNLGHNFGPGNPPNPDGYRTAYLWEQILQRDNWLDILGRFIHLEVKQEEDENGRRRTVETMIFPRYHQWRAVTRLIGTAQVEGPGHRYLVEHSAGSGKSNSIAWLAHRLASLHDAADHKLFDSVIVVTDRTILDQQLQETIDQFEHKVGVVKTITGRKDSKSNELAEALNGRVPIIIVTIQTFPFVLDQITETASLRDRTFAVIADEAHSSQTGMSAHNLRRVLTAEQIEEGEEVSAEDLLTAAVEARKPPPNVSFFAFTATPKAKTKELFGRCPDPDQPPGEDNLPASFDVYSMRQAIEEEFILDVLKNFTPYSLAYRLAYQGEELDEEQVDQSEGLKQVARWVRLHPYNIASKAGVIVDHFHDTVAWRLDGEAKAMVVTGSRKEAVRFKLAIDSYLRELGYSHTRTLVAFSGEVSDPESGPTSFTEANMNPDLNGRDIREAFNTNDFNILVVANKFQTGFDQPKLVAMYMDKRLSGVASVQTLSRLNRIYPGKEETFVLDFVNKAEEIQADFAPYYETAQLAGISDPNIIHDIQAKLDAQRIYTDQEIDLFAEAYFEPGSTQKQLQARISPAVDRFRTRLHEAQEAGDGEQIDELDIFRKDLISFARAYEFLSQVFDYGDTDLEKHYVFFKHLIPLIKVGRISQPIDLSDVVLTHHRLSDKGKRNIKLQEVSAEYTLKPSTDIGTAMAYDPNMATLHEIIARMNELFTGELSDADLITYANHISERLLEDDILAQQAANNTREQFALGDFPNAFMDTIIDGLDSYQNMAGQVLGDQNVLNGFRSLILDLVYNGFSQQRSDSVTDNPLEAGQHVA